MDKLKWCIDYLIKYNHLNIFVKTYDFNTLRALMNITMPYNISDEFYKYQDEILKNRGEMVVDSLDFEYKNNITIYKGDITLLKCDAIVNACNETLLGCFKPLHSCIDNQIHSYAGLKVRRDLMTIMNGENEKNGSCRMTSAYNLPCKYIFHTVGPQVNGYVTDINKCDLANCYKSCLNMAESLNLKTIAFPCISTGVYGYPKALACDVSYDTVIKFNKNIKIIFNVFTDVDYKFYKDKIDK